MTLRGAWYSKQLASSDSHTETFWCITIEPRGASRISHSTSPVEPGIAHHPSAQARMPRSAHMRAYSCSDASTPFGIAPSEWLMR